MMMSLLIVVGKHLLLHTNNTLPLEKASAVATSWRIAITPPAATYRIVALYLQKRSALVKIEHQKEKNC